MRVRNSVELRYIGKVGFRLRRSLAELYSEERCILLIDGTIWVESLIKKERSAVCCASIIRKHSNAFHGCWEIPDTQVKELFFWYINLKSGSGTLGV